MSSVRFGAPLADHLLLDVFAGDRFEGVCGADLRRGLGAFAGERRVFAVGDPQEHLVAHVPRLLQADFGPCPQRDALFLASDVIFQPPQLRAAGENLQVEAALVSLLVGAIASRKTTKLQSVKRHLGA